MDAQFQFMYSQRGQKLIIYKGNKYRRRRQMKNGDYTWSCVKVSCGARVCLDQTETMLIGSYGSHDHELDPRLARQIVNNCVKRAALEEPGIKPGPLLEKVLAEKFPELVDLISPEDVKRIKKAVMRVRHLAKMNAQVGVLARDSSDSESSGSSGLHHFLARNSVADISDDLSGDNAPSSPKDGLPCPSDLVYQRRLEMSEVKCDPDLSWANLPEPVKQLSYSSNFTSRYPLVPQGSPSSMSPVPIAPKKNAPPPAPSQPQPAQPPPEVCLRWNSYHSNMQATFPSLLNNEQFVDVTLACEGRSIKCHKVMLSACSSYFEELLSQNPCQHPIIFMRDMKFWEVQALVEFMYSGEVNVAQEKLPSLLSAAEALQIKGLTPSTATTNNDDEQSVGGGEAEDSPQQPQKRVRKRKSAHPVSYPVRLQNTPPSPAGNQMSPMSLQQLQKMKVPMMSSIPGTSHHREDPSSFHPPVRIKRERSSTPPLALSMKEEPLDLGMDNSERNREKEDSNGPASHNSSLQDAINRLHGKQLTLNQATGPGLMKMESNGGLSEDDGSGSERSPVMPTTDTGEGEVCTSLPAKICLSSGQHQPTI